MLNVIVGANASGKTVCLTAQLLRLSRNGLVLTNMEEFENPSGIPYYPKYLDVVYSVSGEKPVTYDKERLVFEDGLNWSKGFMEHLTLLTKECQAIVIDEPEFRLDCNECGMFATIVFALSMKIPEIWVTTHAVEFMGSKSEFVRYYKAISVGDTFDLVQITPEETYEGLY